MGICLTVDVNQIENEALNVLFCDNCDRTIVCGYIKNINKQYETLFLNKDIEKIIERYYNFWEIDWDKNVDYPLTIDEYGIVSDDGVNSTNFKNVYSNCAFFRGKHEINIEFITGGWRYLRVGIVENVLYDSNCVVGDKDRDINNMFGDYYVYLNNGHFGAACWGCTCLCGERYGDGDVIKISLDFDKLTVTFHKNKQKQWKSLPIKSNIQYTVVVSVRSPHAKFKFQTEQ